MYELIFYGKLFLGKTKVNRFYAPTKEIKLVACCWYTNIKIKKKIPFLKLTKKYNPEEYPKYDNYDAINVNKVKDIPYDYDGVMGVPISFLEKHNPNQFELIDCINRYSVIFNEETKKQKKFLSMINGKFLYTRLIIRKL